jgi:hypothetical protein
MKIAAHLIAGLLLGVFPIVLGWVLGMLLS